MSSSAKKHFLPQTMTRASSLDRLSAIMIDGLLLFFLFSFAGPFMGRWGSVFLLVGSTFYFVIAHLLFAQTIGKKIIGIKLISVNEESVTFIRVLLREIVGRWLCALTLFFGYARLLFFKDKRGLHDLLSGTLVVSEKKLQTSVLRFVGILSVVLLSLSFALYRLIFTTPVLGLAATTFLQKEGVHVSPLKGNWVKGWTIDFFSGGNTFVQYDLRGIEIKFKKSGFYQNGFWKIDHIQVQKMNLSLHPDFFDFAFLKNQGVKAKKYIPSQTGDFLSTYLKILVTQMQIGQLQINKGTQSWTILHDLKVIDGKLEENLLSVRQIYSQDSKILLQAWDLQFSGREDLMAFQLKMTAKKDSVAGLRKDLDLQMQWQGSQSFPKKLKFSALQNRVNAQLFQGEFVAQFTNFTPSQYFNLSPTFKNFNFQLKNELCKTVSCFSKLQSKGTFVMNHRQIHFNDNAVTIEGRSDEILKFSFYDLITALSQPLALLKVVGDDSVQDYVSQLYFSKSEKGLSAEERAIVTRDQIYFKVFKERFDPNKPKSMDTFLIRSPSQLSE